MKLIYLMDAATGQVICINPLHITYFIERGAGVTELGLINGVLRVSNTTDHILRFLAL